MRIAIAGGTGFVGKALTKRLLDLGHELFILTRNPPKNNVQNLTYVKWLVEGSEPVSQLHQIDIVINLAGESINTRWTETGKNKILTSRLEATEAIISILRRLEQKPKALINASAIGYYGTSFTETFTEETGKSGKDFLATTVRQWEEKASEASMLGIRTCYCRFGIILDKEEGALPRMALPYKLFVGGTVGTGEQWMSWIHIDDVVNALLFIIEHETISGPVNFTSPHPIRMKELGRAVGRALRRPHWIPAPSFALKIALGEMSILVLEGQQVIPEQLQKYGYPFQYTQIDEALKDIYSS
ncbi:TIGR01777 family oxidoreductase [Robertmurraya andreesenii]|uniref:Uncharacterized protein (TIGR01777 family) n=1 Tax=Anoxybacillus andreesenii TaxID=1325932 RepID=A0ABT9V5H1_9BACL|nr:TIGR01777 family oxidoreductase [Robertmurraya andreesenii]MDQ0156193.1 uncharacterized protein (TIGR01777 family) [Robertmurraya andreesenii]